MAAQIYVEVKSRRYLNYSNEPRVKIPTRHFNEPGFFDHQRSKDTQLVNQNMLQYGSMTG
jgi:hypothetical protein